MSMKRFLNRSRKSDADKETAPPPPSSSLSLAPSKSNSTSESHDSVKDLQPMFDSNKSKMDSQNKQDKKEISFNFNNDLSLNLNPSISNTKSASVFTKDSEYVDKSIFSQSRKSFSTKQSSYKSTGSGFTSNKKDSFTVGQPLQILDILEENNESSKTPYEIISEKLRQLSDDLGFILNQFNNSMINLTTAVINSIDCFKKFIVFVDQNLHNPKSLGWNFTTYNNSSLRKILKIYLNFYDNLLVEDVYIKLKLLLVKNFNDFSQTLNSNNSNQIPQTMIKPQNFSIGNNNGTSLPNEDILVRIIDKIAKTSISVKEQNGSFIAPITRGISKDLKILCLYFGYPEPSDYHHKLTRSLHDLYDDIHILVMKNKIELASGQVESQKVSEMSAYQQSLHDQPLIHHPLVQKFKLPFRIPTDVNKPPISLSLSIENSSRTSGTVGGYIYPIIDVKKQKHLQSYANSKFAISCGHVCLDNTNSTATEYPHVSAPSSVLISLYKQALLAQYHKIDNTDDFIAESKVAYGAVLNQLEEMFPLKRVKIVDAKTKQERYETRNLPRNRFGQIIWGERTLISVNNKEDKEKDPKDSKIEKRLSDLAIIKVNKNLICDQNYLGDDISFNEFDPALMFDNLYVREVIDLRRYSPRTIDLNIDEVDSDISSNSTGSSNYSGLPVFKYGSTTKFTKGNLNGVKLVYWLDGAIHSSEFIVNAIETNSAFASGGDSGSWILTKLEDVENSKYSKGLGVVGMLHSYDGEFKQFGLFTPMCEILERLEVVTSIKWGVVGCNPDEKRTSDDAVDDEASSEEEDEEEDDDDDEDDNEDSEYESDLDNLDGALPPEID
ncbi:peptidase S64 [Scheffersomyces coipomensis]|uniref:peptidase S64 n=1 Tax=Scheffersomyces coipomensis TaxID=1788519 RepID=UPI00315D6EBE